MIYQMLYSLAMTIIMVVGLIFFYPMAGNLALFLLLLMLPIIGSIPSQKKQHDKGKPQIINKDDI